MEIVIAYWLLLGFCIIVIDIFLLFIMSIDKLTQSTKYLKLLFLSVNIQTIFAGLYVFYQYAEVKPDPWLEVGQKIVWVGENFLPLTTMYFVFRYSLAHYRPLSQEHLSRYRLLRFYFLQVLLLVINFFYPLIFKLKPNYSYANGPLFFSQDVIIIMYFVWLIAYFSKRMKLGKDQVDDSHAYNYFINLLAVIGLFFFLIEGFINYLPMSEIATLLVILALSLMIFHQQITRDPLTGLNNRRAFFERVPVTLRDDEHQYDMLMIDINDFKMINDTKGHAAGDDALVKLADCLKETAKKDNQIINIARYGGDEFIMLVLRQDDDKVVQLIQLIKETVIENKSVDFTISVGQAHCEHNVDLEKIISWADQDLYEEKRRIGAGR
ncbi:GGDEF domain-containing protein [Ligilactobacillus equi]|uniref:ABC superfamily ATP binding cassette transporter, binding protein n=2 Tax=Ligilactobacillus equi TaxID=137357 RepID=V7HYL6_9LACO|nr:GGDEF domain-containing protein [Ligilactobacillus equi]ETA74365.1 ABC superfamily ATP binding cassette transporter, binding protein [Ligilactobacillus equi DPC 6820]KRL77584.1 hypothetical protein FC36_GL001311 [Ligilactobacillus equi DSM 15833 = JCM 10991]